MGERYDVVVTASNPGTWPVLVSANFSPVTVMPAVVVYEGYERPVSAPPVWPPDLQSGRLLTYADLRSLRDVLPPAAAQTRVEIPSVLTGGMGMGHTGGAWAINGQVYTAADPLVVQEGARVALHIVNRSMTHHPMHLHGHMGRVILPGNRSAGFSKDTALVGPLENLTLEFDADNPGRWLYHCHHLYHMERGMARVVAYR